MKKTILLMFALLAFAVAADNPIPQCEGCPPPCSVINWPGCTP
jgi:hypothetical protein